MKQYSIKYQNKKKGFLGTEVFVENKIISAESADVAITIFRSRYGNYIHILSCDELVSNNRGKINDDIEIVNMNKSELDSNEVKGFLKFNYLVKNAMLVKYVDLRQWSNAKNCFVIDAEVRNHIGILSHKSLSTDLAEGMQAAVITNYMKGGNVFLARGSIKEAGVVPGLLYKDKAFVRFYDDTIIYDWYVIEKYMNSISKMGGETNPRVALIYNNDNDGISMLENEFEVEFQKKYGKLKNTEKNSIESWGSNFSADKLLEYKKLLDAGAITQDEYDEKKKQFLNL